MIFEWDPVKAESNLRKHGVDFFDAVRIFLGRVSEEQDRREDYGEDRFQVIGQADGIALFVVYTPRGEGRRIISARRANEDERERYRTLLAADPATQGQDGLGTPGADDG